MSWVKDNNFAGFSFNIRNIDIIREFLALSGNPELEFLDIDLEGFRQKLIEVAGKFSWSIATNTFLVNREFYSVPEEWETEQPERFESVVTEIHELANSVWITYSELIKLGRRKLGI